MDSRVLPALGGLVVVVLDLIAGVHHSSAAEQQWQVSLSPTYTSGNFGTDTRTDFLYVPFVVRRFFRDGDVSLTIPYVSVTTDGRVTLVSGVPNRIDRRGRGSGSGGSGGSGSGKKEDDSILAAGVPPGGRVTNSGLGDVILRGRYYVIDERGPFIPTVALTGRIKFPTADADEGLGTGEFDEGAGIEVSKLVTKKVIVFLDGGYTIIGKPEGFNLRNQWNYDVGAGYYFTKDLLGSVYYEEYRSLVSGLQNPRDFLFAVNYRATAAFRMNASVQVGLSNGAPDYGLTGGVSYRF
ncbi:transporter [Candidatus Nitrospira bockiana]